MEEPERLVDALYRGILRRKPGARGLAYFANALRAGRSVTSIVEEIVASGEFRAQTAVKLFVPPGHFYSPIVDPTEADRHLATLVVNGIAAELPGIALDRAEMMRTWDALVPLMTSNPFPDARDDTWRFAFDIPTTPGVMRASFTR